MKAALVFTDLAACQVDAHIFDGPDPMAELERQMPSLRRRYPGREMSVVADADARRQYADRVLSQLRVVEFPPRSRVH